MKRLNFSLIIISILCLSAFSQTNQILPCPKIELTGPATVTAPGDTLTFSANVTSENSLIYNWTVSAGTVIEGQNSPVIRVATTPEMAGSEVKATVEIKGLPENCAKSASETAYIVQGCGLPIDLDEYEKISFKEEKERLSVVAARLLNESEMSVVFMIYYPQNETQAVTNRIEKISNYLTQNLKISKERFRFIRGEDKKQRTRIGIYPTESLKTNPNLVQP